MMWKMATVNTLESKNNKNEAEMHLTCSLALLAALSTFKLPLKGLHEIFIASSSPKQVALIGIFSSLLQHWSLSNHDVAIDYIDSFILLTKNNHKRKMAMWTVGPLLGPSAPHIHPASSGGGGAVSVVTSSPPLYPHYTQSILQAVAHRWVLGACHHGGVMGLLVIRKTQHIIFVFE